MNKWDELKNWLVLQVSGQWQGHYALYHRVIDIMDELDGKEACKSLEAAGY